MPSTAPYRLELRAALIVSQQSAAWTTATSAIAITLGLTARSSALAAFGAIGLVDAFGSVALAHHFRHALRHDDISERLERIAHRIVIVGLLAVGIGAIAAGSIRLATGARSGTSDAAALLAAISLVALVVLSSRKRSLARAIGSNALLADGHLSAIGAMQAGVTLFGTAAARWLGWTWADPLAASLVGIVAVSVALTTRT